MRKEAFKRVAVRRAFELGSRETFELHGAISGVLTALVVFVRFDLNLTSAATHLAPGGAHNIIKNVRLRYGDRGVTPAIGQEVNNDLLYDLPGKYFGYSSGIPTNGGFAGGAADYPSKNARRKINILQPQRLLTPYSEFQDPDPSVTISQPVFAKFVIPFSLANAWRAGDTWLDMDFVRLLELELEMADSVNEMFAGSGGGGGIEDATIEVQAHTYKPLDTLNENGSGHESVGIVRAYSSIDAVPASVNNWRAPFRTSGNLKALWLHGESKDNGANDKWIGDDKVVSNIILQRRQVEKFNLSAAATRSLNHEQLMPNAIDDSGVIQCPLLRNTGLYMLSGLPDYADEPQQVTLYPYEGDADNSAEVVLDLNKNAVANAQSQLTRIFVEFIPNVGTAAMSRPLRDLKSDTARGIAIEQDGETEKRAGVQATFRSPTL